MYNYPYKSKKKSMNNLARKYPLLGSSKDPDKIGLTVKSIGIALIPLLIAIFRMLGLDIAENDLVQVINAVASITSMVGIIIGVTRKYYK